VRVDILRKRGDEIDLIEVKAKSYDSKADGDFRGTQGQIRAGMLPYLQDIAFQRYVAGLAYPLFSFRSFLMLADESSAATVDGLHQRFRIRRNDKRLRVELAPGTDASSVGAPILTSIAVDSQVAEILAGTIRVGASDLAFATAAQHFAAAYRTDRILATVPSAACGTCEFKAAAFPAAGEPRSGFHECWSKTFGWTEAHFADGTVLDLWKLNKKDKDFLISQGVTNPGQVTKENIGFDGCDPDLKGLSPQHRQWYQCQGDWPGGGDFFFDAMGMAAAMRAWRFPLHFIDFETCTPEFDTNPRKLLIHIAAGRSAATTTA